MDALKALRSMGMGAKVEGPGGDKMLQQAKHIWSMLDDMVDQDPDSYSRFIDKQTREFKEMAAPPKPHMCVKTQLQGSTLYVNIVSWQRVPKPKSDQDNVPLFSAPLDNFKDRKNGETASTIAIAANPEVLAECGVEPAKGAEERKSFINLTLDYVQHLCAKAVSRNFTLLPQSTQFKGDLEKAQKYFTDTLKKAMKKGKEGEEDGEDSSPAAPDDDDDLPDSMMSKLANISTSGAQQKPGQSNGGASHRASHRASADAAPILFPAETRGEKKSAAAAGMKTLIQELHSEEVAVQKPRYSLERSATPDLCLLLRVELPGVTSVSQCQLDISEDDVQLCVEGQYELTVQLPSHIDDGEASAKFSRKQSVLTLRMPLAQS